MVNMSCVFQTIVCHVGSEVCRECGGEIWVCFGVVDPQMAPKCGTIGPE